MRKLVLTAIAAFFSAVFVGSVGAEDRLLRVNVVDADSGERLPGRLYLRDESNRPHYFSSDHPDGTAVRYEKQNWINADSVEYHTTVSAHRCSVELPPGNYRLTAVHGKSHFPETQSIEVSERDMEITVELQRWSDPATRGWYSGDTHLHRTVDELKNVIRAEDLNVALPLTHWVTRAGTVPSAGDKNQTDIPNRLIRVDDRHVIWPRNTEYEIFTVSGQRHTLGALFVLGHREPLELGVPPWKPVIDSAKQSSPNVVFDMDKLDWPFAMVLPTIASGALYELANNHLWRTEFAFREWNTQAPPFIQPPYGASKGGHRQWIDYTLGMYYTLLDCGFRLPPSAGTANGVHPVPAGFSRVYVHLPDGFEYDAWMKGLKQGRSFVTTGPMMYATAGGHDPGHRFEFDSPKQQPTSIPLKIEVISERKIAYGELLVNGSPTQLLRPQNEKTSSGAYRSVLQPSLTPQRSGWFAVRFWEPRPDGQSRLVHSAPWYVEVDGQPVRPHRHEKRYLIDRVRREMDRSEGVVSAEAMNEYERALEFYQSLPVLDESQEVQATARPAKGDKLQQWLDNMILDHRFTAREVRFATGLSWDEAERAIEMRRDENVGRPRAKAVRVLPYPGGRHPRRGFLDGAIHPQRDTKVSVFPPWENSGYVVVDVPEAIFSNLGLTYLAHTHIPTIWDDRSIDLPPLEWTREGDVLTMTRELPNGIVFTSTVTRRDDGAAMKMELTNGTSQPLTGLRVQVCNMLKGAVGFNVQEELQQVIDKPLVAVKAENSDRWIITGWQPCQRAWTNPPVPCVHSDPIFPDCPAGETVTVRGGIWFYQGDQIEAELDRLANEF